MFVLFAPAVIMANGDYGMIIPHVNKEEASIFNKKVHKDLFTQGSGTAEDPYLISNAAELDAIRFHLDMHFRQIADIELDVAPYNDGAGWNPIGTNEERFAGTYDGGHFKILNLFINRPNQHHVGLFGFISGATIKNLVIEDANITGERLLGTLAGKAINSSHIEYVRVVNTEIHLIERFCGGLIGNIDDVSLFRCTSSGVANRGDMNDWNFIGGLIGTSTSSSDLSGSTITECYSTVTVNSENHNSYGA